MEVLVLGATQSHELATAELLAVKGGWMAKSAEGSNLRIAVVGATKEEALERFDGEVAAWARLREDEGDGEA